MVIDIERKLDQKNRPIIRSKADQAWKEALSLYFKDFMALCWPKAYEEIDWSKNPEFLEQELQAIMPEDESSRRVTDKIVKVWLHSGCEAFIIIHIEVQGSGISRAKFTERMMIYRYRIFDWHRCPVASLAILIDDSPTWRPDLYHSELWDSVWQLKFPILKILDFRTQKQALLKHKNPFAIVILAQLGVIETMGDPSRRLDFKVHLTRMLFEKGWDKRKILDLYKFLDGLLALPQDLKLEYNDRVKKIEKERKVSYITTAEWVGLRQGRKEGRKEGRQEGRQEGKSSLLLSLLETKFKVVPNMYQELIYRADESRLIYWSKRVLFAESIEDVFVTLQD